MKLHPLPVLALSLLVSLAIAHSQEKEDNRAPSLLSQVPQKAADRVNPYQGNRMAARAGFKLYRRYCAECHGDDARGHHRGPSLLTPEVRDASSGQIFWVLTNGAVRQGMPSWSRLPDAQRWQIITFLKSLEAP